MLQTERNIASVERKIRGAFRWWARKRSFETFFEHGQWWVRVPNEDEDETYSVVDANTDSGFGFERI